jgi:hypothetical protein
LIDEKAVTEERTLSDVILSDERVRTGEERKRIRLISRSDVRRNDDLLRSSVVTNEEQLSREEEPAREDPMATRILSLPMST